MKLFCCKEDTVSLRIIALLKLLEMDCKVIFIGQQEVLLSPELRNLSPLGLLPILETESVALYKTNPILRHLARLRKERGLTGLLLKEEAFVHWV